VLGKRQIPEQTRQDVGQDVDGGLAALPDAECQVLALGGPLALERRRA
jgi:hypothetical protein